MKCQGGEQVQGNKEGERENARSHLPMRQRLPMRSRCGWLVACVLKELTERVKFRETLETTRLFTCDEFNNRSLKIIPTGRVVTFRLENYK